MSIIQAFVLGLVQGVSEFLPISSSGHLMLAQSLMGISGEGMTLEVLLHVGTLVAVVAVYWKRIWHMICHPLTSELWLLVIATIPAVLTKVLLDDLLDAAFSGAYLGISFIITALLLTLADYLVKIRKPKHKNPTWKDALIMGGVQGTLGILPGVSRSGSTLTGGLASGLTRKSAADFSFLMSIPAILGALVLELGSVFDGTVVQNSGGILPVIVGVVSAALFGFLAIRFMLYVIQKISLKWFALYTALLGILVGLDQYVFHLFL